LVHSSVLGSRGILMILRSKVKVKYVKTVSDQ